MTSAKNRTYENLRYRIITHDLAPMESLTEKELMNHYGIGRTPLREVMIELQRDGLIQRFSRSGTLVAPIDFHLFREIVEIRINLEGLAGQLAAEKITEKQLDALRQILQKVKDLEAKADENLDPLMQCEFDFHNIMYESTHNQKLRDILHELHGISARYWHYLVFSSQELLDQFNDHREMMDALEKRDRKSCEYIMRRHIQNFVDKVKDKVLK
ncbi:HTH-type transcriptional repressor RspR [subsurface metagenome]